MTLPIFRNPSRPLLALIGIGLIVSAVLLVFFYRSSTPTPPPQTPPETTPSEPADSSLGVIHQVFTKNGRVEWILDASEAHQMKEQHLVELENISAVYYFKNNQEVRLTADRGYWHTNSNNVEVLGNVVVNTQGYRMITDSMNLRHKNKYMFTNDQVMIFGPDANLVADSMEFFIDTETAEFHGNVEVLFNENIDINPFE